jgi:hypothetical protein
MESPKRKSQETSSSSPTKRSRVSPAKNKEYDIIDGEHKNGFDDFADVAGARLNSPSLQTVQEIDLSACSKLSYSQQIGGAGETPKKKSSQNGFTSGGQDALSNSANNSTSRLRQRTPQTRDTAANRTVHFQPTLVSAESLGTRAPVKGESQTFRNPPSAPQLAVDEDATRYELKKIALAAFCLCVLGSLLYLSYQLLGIDPLSRV